MRYPLAIWRPGPASGYSRLMIRYGRIRLSKALHALSLFSDQCQTVLRRSFALLTWTPPPTFDSRKRIASSLVSPIVTLVPARSLQMMEPSPSTRPAIYAACASVRAAIFDCSSIASSIRGRVSPWLVAKPLMRSRERPGNTRSSSAHVAVAYRRASRRLSTFDHPRLVLVTPAFSRDALWRTPISGRFISAAIFMRDTPSDRRLNKYNSSSASHSFPGMEVSCA